MFLFFFFGGGGRGRKYQLKVIQLYKINWAALHIL